MFRSLCSALKLESFSSWLPSPSFWFSMTSTSSSRQPLRFPTTSMSEEPVSVMTMSSSMSSSRASRTILMSCKVTGAYVVERAPHQLSFLHELVVLFGDPLDFLFELVDRAVPVFDQRVFLFSSLFHRLDSASQFRNQRILNVDLIFESRHSSLCGRASRDLVSQSHDLLLQVSDLLDFLLVVLWSEQRKPLNPFEVTLSVSFSCSRRCLSEPSSRLVSLKSSTSL